MTTTEYGLGVHFAIIARLVDGWVAEPEQGRWTELAEGDYAMCGDETCRSVGCLRSTVDAYLRRQQEDARLYVRSYLGLPTEGS